MPALLLLFFLGALCAPVLMRRGRLGFIFLAGIPGIALLWFLMELPGAFHGEVYARKVAWLPNLVLRLTYESMRCPSSWRCW